VGPGRRADSLLGRGSELEHGADRALHEGIRKRAASWWTAFHPVQWAGTRRPGESFVESTDCRLDDPFEHGAAQVEAADHRPEAPLAVSFIA